MSSQTSLRRLAIAKEMYLQGLRNAEMETSVNSILAILNFDYSLETFLKATLLDKNFPITHKTGRYKMFDDLITDFKSIYSNNNIISEIENLHKLRNDVQHNVVIPSIAEVNRHKSTVRLFIDDVCTTIYQNSITFESISLSFLVDSQVEKIILNEMENALILKNFDYALMFARESVLYHKRLLEEEIERPHMWTRAHNLNSGSPYGHSRGAGYNSRSDDAQLARYLKQIEDTLDWVVAKLSLQEYYHETKELIGNYHYYNKKESSDQTKAERGKVLAYNIITGSQGWLKKKKDLNQPHIFHFEISKKESEITGQAGQASKVNIKESKIQILNKQNQQVIREIDLPKTSGLHMFVLNKLDFEQERIVKITIKDSNDKTAVDQQSFHISQ